MTMISTGCSLAVREFTVFSMHLASLNAGTSTVTGSVIGAAPQRKFLRRTRRACSAESRSISPKRVKTRTPVIAMPTTRTSVVFSEACTRKTQALPFHRSRPPTGVLALGASSASVRFSNA